MKPGMEMPSSDEEVMDDLRNAMEAGEKEALEVPITNLGLKENTQQAAHFVGQDQERIQAITKSLEADAKKALDYAASVTTHEGGKDAVKGLKGNQKKKGWLGRLFG